MKLKKDKCRNVVPKISIRWKMDRSEIYVITISYVIICVMWYYHIICDYYSEKVVRKEILRARAIPRDALLEKVNNQEKQNKITFNITYHPVFRDVRKILEELHVILASDDGHKKVFPDFLMIGFKINKTFKVHLVRSQLPDSDELGRSKQRGGKRPPCNLCENMTDTCTYKSKHLNEVHKINKKCHCNSKITVYLIDSVDTVCVVRS